MELAGCSGECDEFGGGGGEDGEFVYIHFVRVGLHLCFSSSTTRSVRQVPVIFSLPLMTFEVCKMVF